MFNKEIYDFNTDLHGIYYSDGFRNIGYKENDEYQQFCRIQFCNIKEGKKKIKNNRWK